MEYKKKSLAVFIVLSRGQNPSESILMCYFCPRDLKKFFWGLEDISMGKNFFLAKKNKNDKKIELWKYKTSRNFSLSNFFVGGGGKKLKKLQFSFYHSFMSFYSFLTLIPSKFQKLALFFESVKKFEKLWCK